MAYPEGFIWEYPGFPSLMVSYLKTNDFFYSGHVGMPIILMCEFRILKRYNMFAFCVLTLFVEIFTVLITRAHYTIDIITGAIIAHYIFQNVERYVHYVDRLTFTKMEHEKNEGIFSKNNNNDQNVFAEKAAADKRNTVCFNSEFSPVPIKNEV